VLKHAPHTAKSLCNWGDRPYSRELGAFPAEWVKQHKFWPQTSRIDNVHGDRNLIATHVPVEQMETESATA